MGFGDSVGCNRGRLFSGGSVVGGTSFWRLFIAESN